MVPELWIKSSLKLYKSNKYKRINYMDAKEFMDKLFFILMF